MKVVAIIGAHNFILSKLLPLIILFHQLLYLNSLTLKSSLSIPLCDILHTHTLKNVPQFNMNFEDGSKKYVKMVAIIGAHNFGLSTTTRPSHQIFLFLIIKSKFAHTEDL